MCDFIHFEKYEFIPLDTMVTSCVRGARILMFSLNFPDASSELKCLVFVLYTQVEYQRLQGKNGAKERNLCEEAIDGKLQQMVEW
jgi:hypothetical protein